MESGVQNVIKTIRDSLVFLEKKNNCPKLNISNKKSGVKYNY